MRFVSCLLGILIAGSSFLVAEEASIIDPNLSAEEQGIKIAQKAEDIENGFGDFKVDMKMVLKNRYGQTSTRDIRLRTLEVKGDGDKSISIFDLPRDVKGTAFLSFTHKSGPDDQWLYLPALRRVKRISSRNKSGSFMGSEFAFEDIASQEIEKYTYSYKGTDEMNGTKVYLVERFPVDKNSGYSRQIVSFDAERFIPLQIIFYDRKGVHLKTLTQSDYKLYLGRFWRALRMDMENHVTGKSTRLLWENYKFRTGLTSRDFDQNSLKRAR